MELTDKKFWEENWKGIKLPARTSNSYSQKLISKKIKKIIEKEKLKTNKVIELGGCPGRWPYFFYTNYGSQSDVLDYGKYNCQITQENYRLLGIKGKIYNQNLLNNRLKKRSYNIVISAGLVEHFEDLSLVFKKHSELVKKGGLLIVSVPNIKKSWFYDFFARKNKESYGGYEHVSKYQLAKEARKQGFKILYCDYLGVFNFGLIKENYIKSPFLKSLFVKLKHLVNFIISFLHIKKETKTFSPYIYLIAKK